MPDRFDDPQASKEAGAEPRRRRQTREADLEDDEYEERPRRRRRREEGDVTGGLIPYKNPTALIGYYCGVFSLIPILALVLGPASVVLGVLGLRYAKAHPTAKGTAHAIVALVLGTLTSLANYAIVILAVIAMVAASGKK